MSQEEYEAARDFWVMLAIIAAAAGAVILWVIYK